MTRQLRNFLIGFHTMTICLRLNFYSVVLSAGVVVAGSKRQACCYMSYTVYTSECQRSISFNRHKMRLQIVIGLYRRKLANVGILGSVCVGNF